MSEIPKDYISEIAKKAAQFYSLIDHDDLRQKKFFYSQEVVTWNHDEFIAAIFNELKRASSRRSTDFGFASRHSCDFNFERELAIRLGVPMEYPHNPLAIEVQPPDVLSSKKGWPLLWDIGRFFVSHKIRDNVYEPCHQELIEDYLVTRRKYQARRWPLLILSCAFALRTLWLAASCWSAAGASKLANALTKLLPEPARRWWLG